MLALATVLAIGFTLWVQRAWLENSLNWHHIEFATLQLYWLTWNLLPLTLFAIGKLLQRQGK